VNDKKVDLKYQSDFFRLYGVGDLYRLKVVWRNENNKNEKIRFVYES
jgi:hypothetical protein